MSENNKKQIAHVFATGTDSAKEFNYKVDAESILFDLKVLLREYYATTFTVEEDALKLQFTNGQKFILKAEEII